jgi:glycosyltransferase involved in cell wall biosynthesis
MKVLFIARKFPPSVGGMERFAFDLSNALDDEVDMVKITWGGSNKWLPLVLPVFFVRACWVLATQKIDVIHIQDAVQAPVGWLLHVLSRKPYLVVAHGLDITFAKGGYQKIILPFVRRADAVVSISSATRDEAEKRGVDPTKSTVVTLGTHDDYGVPGPNRSALAAKLGIELAGRKVLLTTGRLVKRKGVEWFVDTVMPGLVAKDSSVLYLVAGKGAQQEAIEAAIARHGLGDNVRLLGRVSEDVRTLLYLSSDVFVMPNIVVPGDMEGFGIVVHEAATAGLPVVASSLEGILDALEDGKNGVLVPTHDAEAFSREIGTLFADDAKRRRFGLQAREYTLATFSWRNIAQQYMAVYRKLRPKK